MRLTNRLLLNSAAFLLAVSVAASAGCIDHRGPTPGPPGDTTSNSVSTSSSTAPPTSSPSPVQKVPGISWNECVGTGGAIPYGNTALMLDNGETPPGWESQPQDLDNSMYQFMVNTCQRVSVGPFERGPVSFMLENHLGVTPPDSCQQFEPGFDRASILLELWVDDPEVAQFLRDSYGLPVRVGTVHEDIVQQGNAEGQTWTWHAEGYDDSTLAVVHPGGAEGQSVQTYRTIWHNETAVSFIDLTMDWKLPLAVFVPNAEGVLNPPMRYAEQGPTPFAGLTSTWKSGDNYGPIYRFEDMECKKPLA